ncbi:hypothetical protein [Romboutsia sp. 1001285H_161024_C4]|uniref:hypothetical protein n=1 Tax=Romboutsia sp. 1001285H_161024_C4 TaxID=2787109 RepID=UPI00189BC338|nr:hypothetical protein [Romboutsia sp. 1001285H_161024_C4]
MTNTEKQICYRISSSIKESFEESGFLRKDELLDYIKQTVDLEVSYKPRDMRTEIVNFIYESILKNKLYKEFLSGKTLMCSKCISIKPMSRFNTYKHNGETIKKTICKKCEYDNHKTWIKNNKEKQKEYDKKKYIKNRQRYLDNYKIWQKNNKSTHNLYNRQYKARLYVIKKIGRDLSDKEHKLINNLVKNEGLTGLKIYKSGVIS